MSFVAALLLLAWLILKALRSPWSMPVGALLLGVILVAAVTV